MRRLASIGACWALLVFVVACGSTQRRPPSVERGTTAPKPADTSAELVEDIVGFSTRVVETLEENDTSNTYSHQRLYGPRRRLGEPLVQLESNEAGPAFVSTDCSGWLSFALNTVSPLHEATLQSQRRLPEHNRAYSDGFALRERWRPWPRSFVVTKYLRTDYAERTGFEPITDWESLQPGDIGAYAMGRYVKPSDEHRPKPKDTGHVFIVVGPVEVVDPETPNYDGRGTLSEKAAKVISVPVIDASSIVHFDPDSRADEKGYFTMPENVPHPRAKPGGVGGGRIWLALSSEGRAIQRRLGPRQKFRAVLARAARLRGEINLDDAILDDGGALLVRVFDTAPREYGGLSLGDTPVHLTGDGGIRLVGGRLVLNGSNDFTGGVIVESGELVVGSRTGLGAGDVTVLGGSVTVTTPVRANSATLSLVDGVSKGAMRLDYKGRGAVRVLRIGDKTYRCGTWGGPDSKAKFVDPVFSGSGMLELGGDSSGACADATGPGTSTSKRRRAANEGAAPIVL